MKTKIDNLLIVSPDFKSWNTRHGHDIDAAILEEFNENTPARIKERRNGIGLFIPNTMWLSEQLMSILSVDKIPKELKE